MLPSFLFRAIWRRKLLIIIVTLVAMAATFMFKSMQDRQYRSTAKISTGITDNTGTISSAAKKYFQPSSINYGFNNLIKTIESRQVVNSLAYDLMIKELDIDEPNFYDQKLVSSLGSEQAQTALALFRRKLATFDDLDPGNPDDAKLIEILEEKEYDYLSLRKKMTINRESEADFIVLQLEMNSPRKAAYATNRLAELFLDYYKEIYRGKFQEGIDYLEGLVQEKESALEVKKLSLDRYKSSNNISDLERQIIDLNGQIRELEKERVQEMAKIDAYASTSANIRDRKVEAPRQNEKYINNQRIINLKKRLRDLQALYIEGGSKSQSLRKNIEFVKREIDEEITRVQMKSQKPNSTKNPLDLTAMEIENENDYAEAKARLSGIDRNRDRISQQLSELIKLQPAFSGLITDMAILQKELSEINSSLKEAQIEVFDFGKNLTIVERGVIPEKPQSSKRFILPMFVGLMVFGMLCLLFLALEFFDYSVRTPEQFTRLTEVPLMGSLNSVVTNDSMSELFAEEGNESSYFQIQIRKLRYEIENSSATKLLVTSTRAQEGKTFFIKALAYSLSLTNKTVIIIDTNLKNNGLTKQFSVKGNLEKYLNGEIKGLANVIEPTGFSNIDIIGCKGGNFTPWEVIPIQNFEKLINDLSKFYDYILMEGAGLNQYSDAKELASFVDKIIPIFSAQNTLKDTDRDSISYLRSLNGKFDGAILNKIKLENLTE